MGWLSEIEEEIVHYSYDSPAWRRTRQMARVIRELIQALWTANKYLLDKKDISLECYLSENLSDDGWALLDELEAKELINDSTAPRST